MFRETLSFGGQQLTFESGEIARQAGGAVLVSTGDTVLFAAATAARQPSRFDFMPLTAEYRLRYSAAGRIPSGYDRRESRPSDAETLTCRLIDRSIRPFFPAAWDYDTQVIVQPLSHDPDTDPEVLSISLASAALMLSDIPWRGPIVGIRIGLDGEALKVMPSLDQRRSGGLDLIASVSSEGVVMVEGSCDETPEEQVIAALSLAREAAAPLLEMQERMRQVSRPKRICPEKIEDEDLIKQVEALGQAPIAAALCEADKELRYSALDAALKSSLSKLAETRPDGLDETERKRATAILDGLKKRLIREGIMKHSRIGGRGPRDVRGITGRVGWLKRCHGSSLFTRGETQAIVTCTLGSERDAKSNDTLNGRKTDRFLLHYNFPPYCVGEVKGLRGPGRREIGHGNLARRALSPLLPGQDEAPYTIRLESLITESNGSSSMATVCGGALALLDAGIELKRSVAGIAMGLVKEGDQFVVLSDILGDEDHVGDMDFKVCGTERGVTAIQLDNKLGALADEVMSQALEQAREGRLEILKRMEAIRAESQRSGLSPHAPRVATVRIETNRIGSLVGAGGKTIRGIQTNLGVSIDVSEDGTVKVFGSDAQNVAKAEQRVHEVAGTVRLNQTYEGTVVGVKPFGSFVRLLEGVEGLLHERQLNLNDKVSVRVTGVNDRGKLVIEEL